MLPLLPAYIIETGPTFSLPVIDISFPIPRFRFIVITLYNYPAHSKKI